MLTGPALPQSLDLLFNLCVCVCVCVCVSRSVMSDFLQRQQAPLSMQFSRQEYRSGLPFPSPGDLPKPGTEPRSPTLQADSLPFEPLSSNMHLI